jgi:glycosyltransferase involved in cell wall biosynthesis
MYLGMRSRLIQLLRKGQAPLSNVRSLPTSPRGGGRETLLQRCKRYAISLIVVFPDDKRDWAVVAALTAVRLIRRHKIGWVLTSSPPESTHLIGLVAKTFTRARWIADFRDAWVDELEDRPAVGRSGFSDWLHRRLEAMVVSRADRIVTTTERLARALAARYDKVAPEKFIFIPNSIDVALFGDTPLPQKYERFTITYTGTLYEGRTPTPLFAAVRQLLDRREAEAHDIRIKLVGNCEAIDGVPTGEVATSYGLQSIVEVVKPVPYSEALQIMQRSHLLLVLAPQRHHLAIPAKIYDYLGSGSVLLALTERGATSDLMDQTGGGRWFSHDDTVALREYLRDLLRDGRFTALRNDPGSFDRYSVTLLTRRLVESMTTTRGGSVVAVESCSQ